MVTLADAENVSEDFSVPIRLAAGVTEENLRAADGAELTVPSSMGRKALRNLIHHLLGIADADPSERPDFHFLVGKNEPLRTTLDLFIHRRGLSTENTLELTYYVPISEPERPEPFKTSEQWLSSIDVRQREGSLHVLTGSYSGLPCVSTLSGSILPEEQLSDGVHGAPIKAVAWLPKSSAFITAGHDGVAKVWSCSLDDPASASVCAIFRSDDVAQETLFDCAAATLVANKELVALGASDGSVWILEDVYDTHSVVDSQGTSAKRRKADVHELVARHVGTTSKDLAVTRVRWRGPELMTAGLDGMVRVWDVDTSINKLSIPGGGKALTALCVSDVSCVVGCADGALRLLDSRDGKGVVDTTFRARSHMTMVLDIAWLGKDATLASGGLDGTVRVWDMRAFSAPVHVVGNVHGSHARSLALGSGVSDSKRIILSAGEDGNVQQIAFPME